MKRERIYFSEPEEGEEDGTNPVRDNPVKPPKDEN